MSVKFGPPASLFRGWPLPGGGAPQYRPTAPPEFFRPRRQPLGCPDVVEKLRGRQGFQVALGQPACQFRPGRLRCQCDTFVAPLDILRGPPATSWRKRKSTTPGLMALSGRRRSSVLSSTLGAALP